MLKKLFFISLFTASLFANSQNENLVVVGWRSGLITKPVKKIYAYRDNYQ